MSNGVQTDPVQALLAQTALQRTLFTATSRYYGMGTDTLDLPQGKTIIYLRRRFVPPPEGFQLLQEHTVVQGDRLDNLAAQYLGDPTLFWRLSDANRAMRPEDLTATAGRKLCITLPEGITGSSL
ncbi:MAG: LysM domain-containing protein [Terriglobia bacterium]